MLVIHQSKYVSAIKRLLFCYQNVFIFAFFHVFSCFSLLPCMLKFTELQLEVKASYNMPKVGNLRHTAQTRPA